MLTGAQSIINMGSRLLNIALRPTSYELVRRCDLERVLGTGALLSGPSFRPSPLSRDVHEYLRFSNPRLRELERRYAGLARLPVDPSLWTRKHIRRQIDLGHFRGDSAFIAHFRDANSEAKLLLTAYHLSTIDERGLLSSLDEDGAFGAHVCEFRSQRLVSRDLLDSIAEIYFLEDSLDLSARDRFNVLDIGAGYGRLAHRLTAAFPERTRVICTDAVALSTFVCEFYLRYRGVERNARVVPLDEIEDSLASVALDLAVNIHSFSECPLGSIVWWLDLLREREVPYLMIVPNAQDHAGKRLLAFEKGGRLVDYSRELAVRGYELVEIRPKYADPAVQRVGISPTHYHLFELRR